MPPPCFSARKNPLDRTRRCPCSSRCVGCHPAFDTRHDHAQRSSVRIQLTVVLLRFPVGLAYCSSEYVQLKIRISMNFAVVQASEQCPRQVQVGAGHHRKKRSVERVPLLRWPNRTPRHTAAMVVLVCPLEQLLRVAEPRAESGIRSGIRWKQTRPGSLYAPLVPRFDAVGAPIRTKEMLERTEKHTIGLLWSKSCGTAFLASPYSRE